MQSEGSKNINSILKIERECKLSVWVKRGGHVGLISAFTTVTDCQLQVTVRLRLCTEHQQPPKKIN